ncbi:MAG: hypothetical protein HS108_08315 [Planctomycetes bacterium]|jgi:hypothetical protein|nr:hypothetical protein [Planctomycetota bacterium]MCL4731569.1 hypothetical protein [Planctomycetota bacterium]
MAPKAAKAEPKDAGDFTPGMVTRIFDRVRTIKLKHPELSRRVDAQELRIRDCLMAIKDALDDFPAEERELITVLVINGVHKMCDEILIDDPDEGGDS